jgi:hypothetical protein
MRRHFFVKFFLFVFFLSSNLIGQYKESQLKAAVLLRILQTVEWPKKKDTSLTIAIYGEKEFARELSLLVAASDQRDKLKIIYIRKYPAKINFDVLYLTGRPDSDTIKLLKRIQKLPILTISDQERLSTDELAILLFLEGEHIRFDVNLRVFEQKGLKISSRVLKFARKIYY